MPITPRSCFRENDQSINQKSIRNYLLLVCEMGQYDFRTSKIGELDILTKLMSTPKKFCLGSSFEYHYGLFSITSHFIPRKLFRCRSTLKCAELHSQLTWDDYKTQLSL